MQQLSRQIRFSVNPFRGETPLGANSFASKPCGEGLAIYFALWVELEGTVDEGTGFLVNVSEIDKAARRFGVPLFEQEIRRRYSRRQEVGLDCLCGILQSAWGLLKDKFEGSYLQRLRLELNPQRSIAIVSEDTVMFTFSEKFEFAAMHKLWNPDFSEEENFRVFGKCANPAGHGHNYVVEVTVETDTEGVDFQVADFEEVVDRELIEQVDHKNLNEDVPAFADRQPTMENIAEYAWGRLAGKFTGAKLESVKIWETDKTYCCYRG